MITGLRTLNPVDVSCRGLEALIRNQKKMMGCLQILSIFEHCKDPSGSPCALSEFGWLASLSFGSACMCKFTVSLKISGYHSPALLEWSWEGRR